MEFVNNSNCDNNTNSVSSKLVQKGIQANSKDDLLYFVCRLVAYLVANIVHDEKEWREWGLPFIRMNLIANFNVTKGEQLLAELEQKFCPLIGHGLSLILEEHNYDNSDSISNSDHGYVYIQKADEFFYLFLCDLNNVNNNTLTNTASTVRDDSNDTEDMKSGINLDELLSSYLLNFFEFSISHAAYDARSRTVAKKMFELFQISSSKFTKLEMSLWERCKTSFSGDDGVDRGSCNVSLDKVLFAEPFNAEVSNVPRNSLVSTFRMWRVAFIAAGGGAMMAMATRSAAPSVINTVVSIVASTNTFGQVTLMLNALLNTASIWTTAAGIVGSFGAGASYAGYKTLKLTEPIKEFLLEPLHMPRVRNVVYDKAGWKKYTNEVFQENENDREDIDEDKDTLVVDNSQTHNGVPVYILISGHIPDGIDARNIWGADGVTANGFRFFDPENHTEMDSKVMTDQNVFKTSVVETEVVKTLTTDSGRIEVFLAKNVINIEDEWEELFPDQDAATSGWWRDLFPHGEEYILNWDRTVLEKLNDSFQKMLKDKICGMVKEEIMKFTPFHGPISAIKGAAGFPLHVWGSIKSIDDPWLVAMDRARQAGILLARVLLAERKNKKIVGNLEKGVNEIRIDTADVDNFKNLLFSTGRPITLVGYGMGARVILHCLETLYNEGQVLDSVTGTSINIALGIIENAVLIGAPVSSSFKVWSAARAVVAGRLINCFSSNDWLLAYLYRCKSYDLSVAGLAPVRLKSKPVSGYFTKRLPLSEQKYLILDDCNDVENVNISHLVKSHSDYADALPHVMKLLHL